MSIDSELASYNRRDVVEVLETLERDTSLGSR